MEKGFVFKKVWCYVRGEMKECFRSINCVDKEIASGGGLVFETTVFNPFTLEIRSDIGSALKTSVCFKKHVEIC